MVFPGGIHSEVGLRETCVAHPMAKWKSSIDKRKGAGAFSSGRRVVNSPKESKEYRSLGMFWPPHTWVRGDWYDGVVPTPQNPLPTWCIIQIRGMWKPHYACNFLEPLWSNQDWCLSIRVFQNYEPTDIVTKVSTSLVLPHCHQGLHISITGCLFILLGWCLQSSSFLLSSPLISTHLIVKQKMDSPKSTH